MKAIPQRIRILIVDDQLVVREGLRLLIENHPGIKIAAMASNAAEALGILAHDTFDLIILNLELGSASALPFIPELRQAASGARILALTATRDTASHQKAVELGAMGVVLKDDAADLLINAIEKVHLGEVWLDRLSQGAVIWKLTTQEKAPLDPELEKIASLTQREREVIALIAEGLKNKQIGQRLFISHTTVTHHLSSIYAKLGVADRLELLIFAFAHKLAS